MITFLLNKITDENENAFTERSSRGFNFLQWLLPQGFNVVKRCYLAIKQQNWSINIHIKKDLEIKSNRKDTASLLICWSGKENVIPPLFL